MNLSVIHRIAGGYLFVFICLIVISIAGLNRITNINVGLQQVAHQAVPVSQLSAKVAAQLASVNLMMNQHYNSFDRKQLTVLEEAIEKVKSDYFESSQQLSTMLANIEGSGEELKRLKTVTDKTPKTLSDIKQLMTMHSDALRSLSMIDNIKVRIADVQKELQASFVEVRQQTLSAEEDKLITEAESRNNFGLGLSKQLLLVHEIEDYHNLKKEFSAWVNAYADFAMRLRALRLASTNRELALSIKNNVNNTISLINIVVDFNKGRGLLSSQLSYLSEKQLMVANLAANEKILQELRADIDIISVFTQGYSDKVASAAESDVEGGRTIILMISGIAIFAGVIMAWLVTNSIRRPLHRIVNVLKTIATGDLTQDVKINRKDEFGRLQRSAFSLNDGFKNMILAIQNQLSSILSSVKETRDISEHTTVTVGDQKQQTDMVVAAVHEMTATTHEIAKNAEGTFAKMVEVHEQAEIGQNEVTENTDQIMALQSEIEHTGSMINQLDENVHQIEEILQVISAIAGQTNLLALNASIEAARAGEQGRGFAVVADEVRTLAGRTRASTEEIRSKIDALLSGSQNAVNAVQASQQKTVHSVEKAKQIHQRISDIVEMVSHARDLNMQIATAAEQQSLTTVEINQNVTRISELTEDTAKGAERNKKQVEELHATAQELELLVDKFKL